ncbi:RrF2 family transcriptional regulator [Pontiella sulfatireligans]|uniref:HTH-type transcriptional regulator IscR n=1 Tax=Pontiella sulfatireligans TaxID=2750658 RepID=A0A6C2UL53_9BACT|nr:Rrf2 family transcriptional regulator [Pontiella sulfatireligans]VGO20960.1 HTH-type transcriptional regulator IscR [Pontiella sulfatireligans]
MKLSTKGRYATRILLCISRLEGDLPVPKKRISEQEGISTDYIEQIIVPLKNAGLVNSVRGLRGGFRLAKDMADITVYDVLAASEGDINLVGCLAEGCSNSDKCVVQRVWQGASDELRIYFSKITLKELHDDYVRRTADQPIMFNI